MLLIASSTGILYSYKLLHYTFFDTKKGRRSLYSVSNREPLRSDYYSNSTLAALLSIVGLTLTAYVISALLLHQLIVLKNPLADVNVLFLKNQTMNTMHIDKASLFNYSFLN